MTPASSRKRYDASGTPRGSEFQVNTLHDLPRRAVRPWPPTPPGASSWPGRAPSQDGSGYGIFARRYDASGAPRGARVPGQHLHDRLAVELPSLSMDAAGNFVVAWRSEGQDGSATASSRSATTPPAFRAGRVPGQHRHGELAGRCRRWRRMPPATSSSLGRATGRTGAATGIFAQRFDGLGLRRAGPSSRSTRTPRTSQRLSRRGLGPGRQLRRGLDELRAGRGRQRRLRAALRRSRSRRRSRWTRALTAAPTATVSSSRARRWSSSPRGGT